MSERGDPAEPLSHGVETDEDIVLEQAETGLDEDDRLRPEFLSAVLDAVEEGDNETARELVSPLHPADIADLLELTPSERRGDVAAALGDLVGAEVLSELNDYVRDDLIGAVTLRLPVGEAFDFQATAYGHDDEGQGLWFTPYVASPNYGVAGAALVTAAILFFVEGQ